NSTEFNTAPTLKLRGETPLLVVDGVPYSNISLNDIAADDIESVDVLKGATASALYGARGGSGAIMVTTKKGSQEGLNISVNSSTMFNAGYLVLPEVQHGYSTGQGGKYTAADFVWGDKLDIGRTAVQYDPYTYEWKEMPLVSKGKDNFKNFLETGFITNNNISISQTGKYGSFRSSLSHVYNKGQYP
ncbi:TonB-dependent receptor plug domain-containing protein, partial [Bacteroides fragilis]